MSEKEEAFQKELKSERQTTEDDFLKIIGFTFGKPEREQVYLSMLSEQDKKRYEEFKEGQNQKESDILKSIPKSLLVEETRLPKVQEVRTEGVNSFLDFRADGKIVQNVRNWERVLEHDQRFTDRIRFNEFDRQTYLYGSVPWEQKNTLRTWTTADDSALFSIIQAEYGLRGRNDFYDAVQNVAMRHRFHPIRDMLNNLVWDGGEHIARLLPTYLGAENTPYNSAVMRLMMIAAVSRVFSPGCKFDYVCVLEGVQGLGKSSFLQALALDDAWFSDSLDSLDTDKAAQLLMGTWIVELAELKSLSRTSGGSDSVKRFISATQDRLRLPYERRADTYPRQCTFWGSTNKKDFLQDETGNRRYLPVECGINPPQKSVFDDGARNEILQAWAQAVHIWRTEHPALVLPKEFEREAKERQQGALQDDGKTGLIGEYLADKMRTCVLDVWQNALGEQGRPAKWQAGEINTIISQIPGWRRMQTPRKFSGFGSQRGWEKLQSATNEFLSIGDEETPFD